MAAPWGTTWGGCWRDPTPCPRSTAAQVTDGSQYHVLLIITDGVISDMMQTKEAIVTVSGHTPPGPGHRTWPRCRRAAPCLQLPPLHPVGLCAAHVHHHRGSGAG